MPVVAALVLAVLLATFHRVTGVNTYASPLTGILPPALFLCCPAAPAPSLPWSLGQTHGMPRCSRCTCTEHDVMHAAPAVTYAVAQLLCMHCLQRVPQHLRASALAAVFYHGDEPKVCVAGVLVEAGRAEGCASQWQWRSRQTCQGPWQRAMRQCSFRCVRPCACRALHLVELVPRLVLHM